MLNGLWEIPNKRVNNKNYITEELNKYIYEKWEDFDSIGNLKSNAYMISFNNFSTALNKLIGGLKLKKSDNETVKFNIKIFYPLKLLSWINHLRCMFTLS